MPPSSVINTADAAHSVGTPFSIIRKATKVRKPFRSVRVMRRHAADAGLIKNDEGDDRDEKGCRAVGENRPLPGQAESGRRDGQSHEQEFPDVACAVVGAERSPPTAAGRVGAGDQGRGERMLERRAYTRQENEQQESIKAEAEAASKQFENESEVNEPAAA